MFDNPLEVSQKDEPDIAELTLNLQQFKDEYGQAMESKSLWLIIPRLLLSGSSEELIEATGELAGDASTTTMTGHFIVNLMLGASLNHLWSMINGL